MNLVKSPPRGDTDRVKVAITSDGGCLARPTGLTSLRVVERFPTTSVGTVAWVHRNENAWSVQSSNGNLEVHSDQREDDGRHQHQDNAGLQPDPDVIVGQLPDEEAGPDSLDQRRVEEQHVVHRDGPGINVDELVERLGLHARGLFDDRRQKALVDDDERPEVDEEADEDDRDVGVELLLTGALHLEVAAAAIYEHAARQRARDRGDSPPRCLTASWIPTSRAGNRGRPETAPKHPGKFPFTTPTWC